MVVLEETALTASAFCSYKRALTAIALPDVALYRGRHIARAGGCAGVPARACRGGDLGSLELRDERRERSLNDCGRISIGNRVPKEILSASQVVVSFARDGDLNLEALGRERRHRCARFGSRTRGWWNRRRYGCGTRRAL
jgi:hypothetical protein